MIKCPYCKRKGAEYTLDHHLSTEHGINLRSSVDNCAWCGCRLRTGDLNIHMDKLWKEHLTHCTAFQAWLLSGVLP